MEPSSTDPYQPPRHPSRPPDSPPPKSDGVIPMVSAMVLFVLGALSSPLPFWGYASAFSIASTFMAVSVFQKLVRGALTAVYLAATFAAWKAGY